ncbi:hypothetical protein KW807_01790 [Candidatus Parcubacteria bacterium]|nr:hypothetical protein [Candidatus Parcubacteria bacterium]
MKIQNFQQVFDRFVGGTLTWKNKGVHTIQALDKQDAGHHDTIVYIVTTDGTRIFAGYDPVEGVEHEGKFYIDDDWLILKPKK